MLSSATLCAWLVQPALSQAQTSPAAAPTGAVETVVVTAEKRSEQLKDVPQSISVLNQRYLDQIGADSLETFANTVPGLQMQTFAPGQTRITIRGISPDEQTGVTAVSYYLDEVPIAAPDQRSQPEVWLYDISQVEVLRGPQGTLWGEGAMGGTIHIITNKPDTSDFEASMLANLYTIDQGGQGYKLDAMLNIPIIKDMLAVRVVFENRFDAGWITDRIESIPNPLAAPPARYVTAAVDQNANNATANSLRAQVRFTPTSRLTIDGEFIDNGINSHTSSIGDLNAYNNIDLGLRPSTDVDHLYNATVMYAFDDFTVTSASTYSDRTTFRSVYQEPYLLGPAYAQYLTTFFEKEFNFEKGFTEEVRAVSDNQQPFRWTAGFFYQNALDGGPTIATGDIPAFGIPNYPIFDLDTKSTYNTYAFFGQAEYDILSNLTAILGGRWFNEGLGNSSPHLHSSTDGFTPLATLRYRFSDDWMAYATFSEGYRSGGFNPYAGPETYAPDKTKNYELGSKYVTPDNRLSLQGDVYYIDWSNMQYTQLSPGGFFTYVGNASKASSRGLEFTGEYHWDYGLWGQLNADWTDAHLDSAVPLTQGFLNGIASAGTSLPAVPPYKVSATAGYDTTVMDDYVLELTGVIDFVGSQHTKLEEGAIYVDPFGNQHVIGTYLQPYSSGNIRAELSKDSYSIAFYINNVWNNTNAIADDNFLVINSGQPVYYLQPRTFGVELAAHF